MRILKPEVAKARKEKILRWVERKNFAVGSSTICGNSPSGRFANDCVRGAA